MFELPKLPYEYNALEPHLDEQTMHIHHDKHHQAYTDKFNAAIKGSDFENKTIEEILGDLDAIPEDKRTAVRNNGGGFYNHALYWEIMGSNAGGIPEGKIAEAINSAFGSFDEFKKKFSEAAATQFGSGWAVLAVDNGKLEIAKMSNQDTPLSEGKKPILLIDVWEHSYYLKYQNRRPEYIEAFYNVINWKKVEELYKKAKE
ncbi:MAG: superoxide dismutase [Candidatus Diapherotrites archaeon]